MKDGHREGFKRLNDQLLCMDWLAHLVRLLIEDVFGLGMASRLGGSLHVALRPASLT